MENGKKLPFLSLIAIFMVFNLQAQNFDWAYNIGGTGADQARHAVTDPSGNLYVAATFTDNVDIDPGNATNTVTSAGAEDIFLAKYSSTGSLVWGYRFGGILADQAKAIYTDGSYIYVTGNYRGSVNFDPALSAAGSLSNVGQTDIFIAKYTVAGAFVWAKGIGGTLQDEGSAITADANGNVYVTGYFQDVNVDFDPGTGTALRSASNLDIFILKLDASGNFGYATCVGGTSSDRGSGITVDASMNVYVTGQFFLTVDFDAGANVTNLTDISGGDIFVAKYNPNGNLTWAFSIGGFGPDQGNAILTDASGNIFVTGVFQGTDVDFDPGANEQLRTSSGSSIDFFLAKYTSAGNYVFANGFGSGNTDKALAMAKDNSNNIYITGSYNGTVDFNAGAAVNSLTSASDDVFVVKYDNNGNYGFAMGIGGTSTDEGYGVGVSNAGSLYVSGYFQLTADFDPGAGTQNLTANNKDVFIAKYCIPASISTQPLDQNVCSASSVNFTVTPSGPGNITYQWKKAGANLVNGTKITGATSNSLTISNVNANDVGSYTVEVGNGCLPSVTSTAANLTLSTPPSITNNPSAVAICQGQRATFSVTATGTNLTYQWQKAGANITNGGVISGTTTRELAVDPAGIGNAGSYRVIVSGACTPSATSTAVVLTVNTPPAMSVSSSPVTTCNGSSAGFSVIATGTNLTYQWQKEGVNISNGGNILGADTKDLTINPVNTNSAGNYRVVINGTCAPSVTSPPSSLTVNTSPSITMQPTVSTTRCAGEQFNLTVDASGTNLTYQWQKNGVNINNGGSVTGANLKDLVINPVAATDAGNYKVIVSGTCAPSVTSNTATLNAGVCAGVQSAFDNYIKVYPNPNTGKFMIDVSKTEGEDMQVSISDITGTEIWEANFKNSNDGIKENIDLEKFDAGVYLLKVKNNQQVSIRKIIINK